MQIFKAISPNQKTYFAIQVKAGSPEMQRIKSCPFRYWNKQHNVWLIPYSKHNWSIIKQQLIGIPYTISKEIIYLGASIKIVPEKSVDGALRRLSPDQQDAVLKMKEHLIIKRYQPTTHRNYINSILEFFGYYHDKLPAAISFEDIKSFMLHKINKDRISESTQNCLINAIKFYYEKVEGRARFTIQELRPRRPKQLPGFLSKEEVTKLLRATANIKHRSILQLIYSAGLRLSELTRLKVRDIKFTMGIIEVKCAKGKKDRITILSDKVKILLREYMEQYQPTYYLFEGQTGGKYSDRSVQAVLHQAVIKSGVDENTTVHTLRHSFATHLILNGVDIRIIQEYLGHSSPKTTAIYTHITDKMKTAIKSPLDDLDV